MTDHVREETTFFMVWTKKGHVPRFTHNTRAEAEAEADRLAAQAPGKKFVVLQAVSKVHVPAEPVSAQSFGI